MSTILTSSRGIYFPNMKHDWSYKVYGNVQESIPNNCPKPLGKSVTTTTTLDAIFSTAMPLVNPLLHASTSLAKLQLTGIPRSKHQWKQLCIVLCLWLPRQQLNRYGPEVHLEVSRCPHQVKILCVQ